MVASIHFHRQRSNALRAAAQHERIGTFLRRGAEVLCLIVVLAAPVAAQTTGKLTGLVTDANTGEPLVGANVIVSGTTTGISSGIDGSFLLLGAPVGTYDIEVSYVGYETKVVEGVEINAGYTRELNVALRPGVEFERVVVEYERPLIQKDAVGVPRFVTSEEIIHLPVRGIENVAAIQAGVVSIPGREELFVRGGRSRDIAVFVDGVRVIPDREQGIGIVGVPQSAIQEQEMQIGNISARYGDVMSGILNVVTKSGRAKWFGSLEATSSRGLDDFGSNLVSASVGGPIGADRSTFFASAEYSHANDGSPRAVEMLRVDENELERLRENPQVVRVTLPDGSEDFATLPGSIANGAVIPVGDDGSVVVDDDGRVTLSDGTVVQLLPGSMTSLNPISGSEVIDPDFLERRAARLGNESELFSGIANLTFRPFETGRLRLGGRYAKTRAQQLDPFESLFAPEAYAQTDDSQWQAMGSYTHYFDESTILQAQIDYSDRSYKGYDSRFTDNIEDVIHYGDIDHEVNQIAARYKGVNDQKVLVPLFQDGNIFANSIVALPGVTVNGYEQFHHTQWHGSVLASTQIGIHQLELGAEFEQRTRRRFELGRGETHGLARWIDDSRDCSIGACGAETGIDADGNGEFDPVNAYPELPVQAVNARYYGYDYLGLDEVSDQDFAGLVTNQSYDVEPWRPRYYGAYVQDKVEFQDLVLNLGLRVDVYDNNSVVFTDPFARVPIVRANAVVDRPGSVSDDYAVYFDGDEVVGYRDREGTFYDMNGQETSAPEILSSGVAHPVDVSGDRSAQVSAWESVFEDYKPAVTWMPRFGASFPITDRGLVYGSYGVASQRSLVWNFPDILRMMDRNAGSVPNTALVPERTIDYELGYRHRISRSAAATISGFFRQIKDMEAFREVAYAFPRPYLTMQNEDFGTVKGFQFDFQLRRSNNVAVSANYTLSWADGTGSHALSNTNSSQRSVFEESKTVFPLDFDTRHALNASFDLRYGAGQGPRIGSIRLLEHFGFNMLVQGATGLPYTARAFTGDLRLSGEAQGSRNSSRMPATGRVNLRIDRRIGLGSGASVSAYLWIVNLFDWQNVYDVYSATGLPDSDGFLLTPIGIDWLASQLAPDTAEALYDHRSTDPDAFGVPRQVVLGLRFSF